MSPLLDCFASPAWSRIVETLLHSLWQGAVLAVGLYPIRRRVTGWRCWRCWARWRPVW